MLALLLVLAQDAPTREERVLAVLRGVLAEGQAAGYGEAYYELAAPPAGARPVLVPRRLGMHCGAGGWDTIDAGAARRAARALGSAYGLELESDAHLDGARFVLDGADSLARVAFELRCAGWAEAWSPPQEADHDVLDPADLKRIESRGWRVFVADVEEYRPRDDDRFTATLAWLAGFGRFLDEVTDGEDVELGGLLFEREAIWEWPVTSGALPPGVRAHPSPSDLVVERAATLSLRCGGRAELALPRMRMWAGDDRRGARRARALVSSRGAPSVLHFSVQVTPLERGSRAAVPAPRLRVRQRDGERELVHETAGFTALLPSAFELAEPFEVELDLAPGRYFFWEGARLGGAARE